MKKSKMRAKTHSNARLCSTRFRLGANERNSAGASEFCPQPLPFCQQEWCEIVDAL